MKKIAIIGSGAVGEVLAGGFLGTGHDVMRASREPEKLKAWQLAAGKKASVGTPDQAAAWGDAVVLAVKGTAAKAVVEQCGPGALAGKLVMDTTNPIENAPPENGVLRYFTDQNGSLMETLQEAAPEARFVKVFSCVGSALMVEPRLGGQKPTMFICGNDAGAKKDVTEILSRFGWETEDMGAAQAARAIEPLCMLWCIPGFLHGTWTHAFKLLKG